jgi:glycosyltransferase involved in cell wall biosynthesis
LFPSDINAAAKRYQLAKQVVRLVNLYEDVELITLNKMTPQDVSIYMNACDLMLFTSSQEGSPNVIKEAMACNLPIVSTAVGDVYQRIGRTQGCIVCKGDSSRELADAALSIINKGVETVTRQDVVSLDETLVTKKLIKLYRSAVSK